ncbi:hypothetical protein GGI07_000952 [Coemansia sp. Benny D115]|nr:hypothetical protein GGI07_000952 [Coemansia sp. Benny D115]
MAGSDKTAALLANSHEPQQQDEHRRQRHQHGEQRRLLLVRNLGIFLLCIPVLLVFLCTAIYFYGIECPSNDSTAHHQAHAHHQEYLTMYPVNNKHNAAADSTMPTEEQAEREHLVFNGTHWFRPTVVLVSVDGFRADYLDRNITPALRHIGKQGLRADYMIPSFPSSTFPNHYTIVTGLYPGSHGIVSNEFYDSQLNDTFVYKDATKNVQTKWWEGGEPIWVTAEKQGLRAGIDMWPGSTAVIHGSKPSYLIPFSNNVHPTEKTQQLLEWLDMPFERRPSFLATYMPEVDSAAHKLGPDAKQVNDAISMVDEALGDLWAAIAQRNLTNIVNLMIVSDHGMAASRAHKNAVYLDDYIDTDRVSGVYGWPLAGIQPKDLNDVPDMYSKLKAGSKGQPWKVYLREDVPERFHYTHPTRIAPIIVVPEVPYYVTTRASGRYHMRRYRSEDQYPIMGVHGYDNMHPLMRATFVAVGPAFRSRDTKAPPFHTAKTLWSANTTMQFGEDSEGVHIQMADGAPDSSNSVSAEQIIDDGALVSDMDAEQDYLDLVRNALVSSPRNSYRAENDWLWGEGDLSEAQLRNIRSPPFENVELYGLMTKILGLVPAPNNGTAQFSRWWLKN